MAKEKLEKKNLVQDRSHEQAIFQAMAENAVDGMTLSTLEGVITYANPADHVLFGYDPKSREMVGLHLFRFFSEDSLKVLVEEAIPQALDGASWQGEVHGIRKDGTQFDLLTTIFPIRDERGDPIALTTVMRSITERKRAEEALQESEEKYRAILENVEDGYYEVDVAGNLTFFNDPLCRILGYPKDELMGMNNRQYMDDETAKAVYQTFNAVYRTGKPAKAFGWEIIRKDGTKRFVESSVSLIRDSTGEPAGFRGIVRDITDRKRTEEALQASEERFALAVQGSNDGIWDWDIKNNSLYWSPRLKELLGYADDELDVDFDTFNSHLHPDDREPTEAAIEAHLKDRVPYDVEERLRTKSGQYRWFRARGQALWDEAGNPVRMTGSITDITERKRTEAERERLLAAIEHRSTQLQTSAEVSRAASSILDPDELIQQVVDLVRERFDLYYAGLFVLDEERQFAVLRAGTGQAGRKMLEAGHKLEVGGESMIGQCVARGEARIALDVGEEAVRFDNPLLPETRSEMALPLISRGQIIGAMTIQSAQAAAFSEEDITVLQTMADQLAIAIENARLFEDTKSRLAQLTALQETTRAVASTLELDKLLNLITQQATTLLQGDGGIINLVDWEKKEDEVVAGSGSAASALGYRSPLEGSLSGWVTLHNQPVISNQLQNDSRADWRPRSWLMERKKEQAQSAAIAPLTIKGQVMGTLVVMDKQGGKGEFDQDDLNLLITFANQAATAIENARLFKEIKANLEEITLLHRRYLQQAWGEFLEEETGQERAGYMYDQGTVAPASTVWRPEIGLAVQQGDTIALPDMADALQGTVEEVGEILQASPTQSALAVPLKVRGQVIGALDFYETDQARDWSTEDIAMVEAVANQVALAIENARAYEELQKTAEQLKEMDKLKTQFLANMSHELRTPLNSIIGFSRVILKGIDGPITEQQRADLTSIYNNGQYLLGMINDILDISKIEAGKMEMIFEPVNVQQIISGVMSTAIALVKDKPIELKQEVAPNLPTIRGDATRVRQVILNLLSNAAKFTEEGQITLQAWADEKQITISVKDTGIGISPEHQTTIFEEFHQVDASTTRRTGGTGLGLAISRHFVEMHGGHIWVESEPGVGSTFTFTLPVTGPAPVVESELADLTIDPSRRLILAVEDDEGAIAIYKRYLEKQGYQVVGLNQGEQAVRWARELSPYVIILDVLLPDKDGWTVLEELKSSRETHQIPVIICTIVDDEEAHGLSLGAADYLVKPVLEEDLLQSLQRLEERQRI